MGGVKPDDDIVRAAKAFADAHPTMEEAADAIRRFAERMPVIVDVWAMQIAEKHGVCDTDETDE